MEPPAEYAEQMRMFTTDENGRRVLRGLSSEETAWYLERNDPGRNLNDDDTDRFLELHDRHERSRMAALAAESELRHDEPTEN